MMMPNMLAWGLSMPEMMLILIVALLLFGKRLPEVARSMGKSVVEFKKGMSEVTEKMTDVGEQAQRTIDAPPVAPASGPAAQALKFDPYTGKPVQPTEAKV